MKLKNVRSYVDESISFPQGVTLLSGDIGSGKTTILLALEFAVFGLMKGVLSGSALLRHGSQQGSVTLNMLIGDDDVSISRSLKRSKSGIVQEPGTLVVNGSSFEGTPQELKSRILDLLGYLESLLTKSKSLIFRYTVFTPQEEMKRILYESRDERLDILRRLFNIDKYKRVKDNVLNYSRELRNQVNFSEGKLDGLAEKRREAQGYKAQLESLRHELSSLEESLSHSEKELASSEESLKRAEAALEKARSSELEAEVKRQELQSRTREAGRVERELDRARLEVEKSLVSLEGFDASRADEIQAKALAKRKELSSCEEKLSEIISRKAEALSKKASSESIISKISKIDKCPTCLQEVSPGHVDAVKSRENVIISACNSNVSKLDEFEQKYKERKKALESELENYAKSEREFAVKSVLFRELEDKKRQKASLEKELLALKKRLDEDFLRLSDLEKMPSASKEVRLAVEEARKLVLKKRESREEASRAVVERRTRSDTISRVLLQLEKELGRLKEEESRLAILKERRNWLESDFLKLVDSVEKSVLARIYSEFNSFFQEWFGTLIEDDTIKVWLDDSFSPVIEQNGYETFLENLSGGEKTSVALAYRLALNRVVNDFLSGVRTRDLIILDEPTEGFSTEQLDRVREVLNQANLLQTLVVSHESKMEGFADQVIRVSKQNHTSRIFS
ncbi:SMC family ATPase [Candidatus Woesearchaeota archaeon]|nr:SMC family ATPase [Candidatus Woesearchaeota archaeon]